MPGKSGSSNSNPFRVCEEGKEKKGVSELRECSRKPMRKGKIREWELRSLGGPLTRGGSVGAGAKKGKGSTGRSQKEEMEDIF